LIVLRRRLALKFYVFMNLMHLKGMAFISDKYSDTTELCPDSSPLWLCPKEKWQRAECEKGFQKKP
jgi:hypothetical protein